MNLYIQHFKIQYYNHIYNWLIVPYKCINYNNNSLMNLKITSFTHL